MRDEFVFKGQTLHPGDIIAFTTSIVPLPEVQAVVIAVHDGVLEVMSTLLAPFQHSGHFAENNVGQLLVICEAEEAIPRETRGKFSRGQAVRTSVHDRHHDRLAEFRSVTGNVLAAFDGVVVMRCADGQLVTGGIDFFFAAGGVPLPEAFAARIP